MRPYTLALNYLAALNIDKKSFIIVIRSELDSNAIKLGLGSSGAFNVGIIKAILSFHGVYPSPLKVFKLAVLSQFELNNLSSFGDLSVHAFNQWILYKTFDELWLRAHKDDDLTRLLDMPWKGLKIIPFTPKGLYGFALNSGVPSSSTKLVKAYKDKVSLEPRHALAAFMDKHTLAFYHSLYEKVSLSPLSTMKAYLETVSDQHELPIHTTHLDDLIKGLETFKGVVKISGAGGGDSLIAFFHTSFDAAKAKGYFTHKSYAVIKIGGVASE